MPENAEIDGGRFFDWGRASQEYAKYRDIYPEEFYQRIVGAGLCVKGQRVLDLGTGTGVLPRNLYRYGAEFVGTDISPQQIGQARALSAAGGMDIAYECVAAEECRYPDGSFDVATACQCFFYFNHQVLAPRLSRMLKPDGRLALLYMAWLPGEDTIAAASEKLVLRYNPSWSGGGETRHEIFVPQVYEQYFEAESSQVFDLQVPFTRESWNGRIKACRGIGASLSGEEIAGFEREHRALLAACAPEEFRILHYAAITVLKCRV